MDKSNSPDRTLSLGDKEIPILFDGLLITKEQAASLTEEELEDLQKWGEDLGMNISQEPERDASGYVYLARTETVKHGVVHKIGESKEPGDRVQVFDTKMPVDVEIVNSFPVDDSTQVESILQDRHDADHVKGEWYDLNDIVLASLAHATGFEDGEITFTTEAAAESIKDVLQALRQDDVLLDAMVEDSPSGALAWYMKCSLLLGTGELFYKLQDRVVAEERTEARAQFIYWFSIERKSSPPEEWDTPPERVVQTVLFVLTHHPDLEDDRMQSLANAIVGRCLAASGEIHEIVRDVMDSRRGVGELIRFLMSYTSSKEEHSERGEEEGEK